MSVDVEQERVSIHGRIFQRISIDEGIYFAPVAGDGDEEDRLTAQHNILCRLFGDGLVSSKVRLRDPSKILDLGYGGGDWSVQIAEEYEDAEVTGVDIFPMTLTDQPDNLHLCEYDLNDRLDPSVECFQARAYNLIHSRFVGPGIKRNRWPSYIRDMRLLLRPGGYIQVVEYHLHVQSDNGSLTEQSAVYRWWKEYSNATTEMNRDARVGAKLKQLLEAAGIRDVHAEYMRVPIGGWDLDPVRASIGRDAVTMVGDLLESHGLWPLTGKLGWTLARFNDLVRDIHAELRNAELRLYLPIWVVTGRR